jgi:hypothetical protein
VSKASIAAVLLALGVVSLQEGTNATVVRPSGLQPAFQRRPPPKRSRYVEVAPQVVASWFDIEASTSEPVASQADIGASRSKPVTSRAHVEGPRSKPVTSRFDIAPSQPEGPMSR